MKLDEYSVDDKRKFRDEQYELSNSSLKRQDVLTISIAGAALYICLDQLSLNPESFHIKVNSSIFLISIISNFLSNVSGRWAAEFSYRKYKNALILEEKNKEYENSLKEKLRLLINKYENLENISDGLTAGLNTTSVLFLLGGLISLIFYIF